jgi:uncharacterized membrane protein YhaH (DUF805 family)
MSYYVAVLKKYATFGGRARRKEFWFFVLFNMIISIVLGYVGRLVHFYQLGNIYSLAVLVPSIAVGIRRMHDIGKSGWFILIPIYNLVLACTDSEASVNTYGPNPKAAA